MSKSAYANGTGGMRRKNIRETYVEQLSQGRGLTTYGDRRRKNFTQLHSFDDSDLAFRSTSNYLRQLQPDPPNIESLEMMFAQSIPRTKSATEMTPRGNLNRSSHGNPKYKAQEDYYDEIQNMKKELKSLKDENSNLRAKNRRLEEDNVRKRKEIDTLYDPSKDGDLRRTLTTGSGTDRNNHTNVVMSLKQRIFKLETQLKQKENKVDEMESDPRWTRSTELEIQNRALMGELDRQKMERLNYIKQYDYPAVLEEEKKNALIKLETERKQLKKENRSLKRKLNELGKSSPVSSRSSSPSPRVSERETAKKFDIPSKEHQPYQEEIEQLKEESKKTERHCDHLKHQLTEANEHLQEIKKDRDDYRNKFERAQEELEQMRRDRERQPISAVVRSSSPLLHERPQSPRTSVMTLSTRDSPRDIKTERTTRMVSSSLNKGPTTAMKKSVIAIPTEDKARDRDQKLKKIREQQAARTIQRGWRKHEKPRRTSPSKDLSKARQENLDKWSSRIGSKTTLPDGSSSPPRSRAQSFVKDPVRSRPSSPDASHDSALKTVQASLRGYLTRHKFESNASSSSPATRPTANRIPKKGDDESDDEVVGFSRASLDQNNKDRPRTPTHSAVKIPSADRFSTTTDRLSNSKMERPASPKPTRTTDSKPSIPSDRSKPALANRFSKQDRDSVLARPGSPAPMRKSPVAIPHDEPPRKRQGSTSSQKSNKFPATNDDDDDVMGF